MLLKEIVLIKTNLENHGIEIDQFPKDKKSLGKIEGFEIFYQSKNEYKLITISEKDKNILMIVGAFLKHGSAFFQIQRVWVEPEFRGKSLMRKVLQLLKRKWDISFISDRDLTPSGFDIWKRFKTDWNVSIFDATTRKRIPWTDRAENELFVTDEDYQKIRGDSDHPLNVKAQTYYLVSEDQEIFNSGKNKLHEDKSWLFK
jgi:hypothetical protein